MNPIADEILSYFGIGNDETNDVVEDMLMHYGIKRRSGRYPWGSGEDPYQHSRDFLGRVEELRKQGFTYTDEKGKVWTGDTAIAKSMGLSSTDFRTEIGICNAERRMLDVARAKSLKSDGLNNSEIGRKMGINESSVRELLKEEREVRMNQAQATANMLKERSKEFTDGGMIDVGKSAELELNISKEKLNQALYLLKREGWNVYSGRFEQVTNRGQFTTQRVLCPPGVEHKEIYDLDRVHTIKDYITRDGGETYEKKFTYPESLDSKRMMIRYNEEGGLDKDGIIELRRNVPDLSLGESNYSQVRILVDKTHFLKGMAVYSDDMPDGVDVIFNTNKKKGTPMEKVLKEIKPDPDNPFGSAIKDVDQGGQYWYDSKTGERIPGSSKNPNKKLGLINKRADEGDWDEWSDALPSQFLSKQTTNMAKKQLNLAKADKLAEYDEICSLENPTIKKYYLKKFADSCDSAAVHLKAAALPGQKYHVIIPINSLKDNEVYAPGYEPGTKLALIRYPHGGTFEIPILTVTHKNPTANKIIGKLSVDAVGINKNIADRLSGADFDGDTVMCIPTHDPKGKVKISSTDYLPGLIGFDPKEKYGPDTYKGKNVRIMSEAAKQNQMGVISNLITDMTLLGASDDEVAAAVRHSMVVIDAPKHKLDYKQSEIDNNIAALHKKYQGKATGGATTIVSKAKGQYTVDRRQGSPKINIKGTEWYDPSKPEGAKIWKVSDDLYYPDKKFDKETKIMSIRTSDGKKITYDVTDKEASKRYSPVKRTSDDGTVYFTDSTGTINYKVKKRTQASTKMAETDDAYSLVSPARHPMELIYADYANSMKSLANQARKESMTTGKIEVNKTAKKTYSNEVASLNAKLNNALLNNARERAAQRMANHEVSYKLKNDIISKEDTKKASQQALNKYRNDVGSISRRDRNILITDKEWEAIQAGAISESKLKQILDNADVDSLRERAMPKTTKSLSTAQINRIKSLSDSNYTLEQIAQKMGKSTSTISKYLKGGN